MHILALALFTVLHTTIDIVNCSPGVAVGASSDNCTVDSYSHLIGRRATCPFVQDVEVDETRLPAILPKVRCICPDRLCTTKGDFRCQEVYTRFIVLYKQEGSNGPPTTEGEVMLPTSCVCATHVSLISIQNTKRTDILRPIRRYFRKIDEENVTQKNVTPDFCEETCMVKNGTCITKKK